MEAKGLFGTEILFETPSDQRRYIFDNSKEMQRQFKKAIRPIMRELKNL
jgi:hypothetical protein